MNRKRLWLVLGIVGSVYGLLMALLGYAWYARQWTAAPFHFFDDLPEWQQMDKLAHCFWTFQVAMLLSRLLVWSGLDHRRAWWASAGAFLLVSLIEVPDGFSDAYGASVYDMAANALGAIAFGVQVTTGGLLQWIPKFSFHPSGLAPLRPELLGDTFLEQVLKDYNGQTFWYSYRPNWLPLPKWLALAVGVRGDGMVYGREEQNLAAGFTPGRRYYFSIDLNFGHLQPASGVGKVLIYVTRIFKVPAPAIEISSEGVRIHAMYF